jgi:predicted TIM-barrel fold metal-dependent hydrolase
MDALLRHFDGEPELVGALLILNTEAELDFVGSHVAELPPGVGIVPYYQHGRTQADIAIRGTGWFKVHPTLHKIKPRDVDEFCAEVRRHPAPGGIIVHCFPWGTSAAYNSSLPLVLGLAAALPETPILATHGGGYESWAFRAHASLFRNVLFDFSVSLEYYSRSDLLRPLQRYLRHRPDCLLFGSDWPTAESTDQIAEMTRLADEIGVQESQLERLLLENSQRLWPSLVPPMA